MPLLSCDRKILLDLESAIPKHNIKTRHMMQLDKWKMDDIGKEKIVTFSLPLLPSPCTTPLGCVNQNIISDLESEPRRT